MNRGGQPHRYQDHDAARIAAAFAGGTRRALRLRRLGHRGARGRAARRPRSRRSSRSRGRSAFVSARCSTTTPRSALSSPGRTMPRRSLGSSRSRRRRTLACSTSSRSPRARTPPHGAVHDHREPGGPGCALAVEPRGRGVRVRDGLARSRSSTARTCTCSAAGDSIYYDSIVPHQLRAHGDAPARILAVVYAPVVGGRERCSCIPNSRSASTSSTRSPSAATPTSSSSPTGTCAGAGTSSTSASTGSPRAFSPSAWSRATTSASGRATCPTGSRFAFATAKIGVVLVTVNPVYKSHELAYVIKQSDMKALAIIDAFRDVDYIEIVRGLVPESMTQERGRLDSAEFPHAQEPHLHGAREAPRLLQRARAARARRALPTTRSLRAAKTGLTEHRHHQHAVHLGDDRLPQGRHAHAPQHPEQRLLHRRAPEVHRDDRICLPVPLFHCFGIVLGVLAALTHGSTRRHGREFDPVHGARRDPEGAGDRALRRADDVHRRAGTPDVRHVRPHVAAHRHHGGLAVPDRDDAAGHRQDARDAR